MLCQKCKKQDATVHLTDLVKGEKREKHLCQECAADEGIAIKQPPLNEVLHNFLTQSIKGVAQLKCSECGMTFVEFRSQGLLGCPRDYDAFGEPMVAVIQQAQDGKTQHTGKAPGQTLQLDLAQQKRLGLQRQLRDAIDAEDYEQAAKLRDELNALDGKS